jgi:hypothetical protein
MASRSARCSCSLLDLCVICTLLNEYVAGTLYRPSGLGGGCALAPGLGDVQDAEPARLPWAYVIVQRCWYSNSGRQGGIDEGGAISELPGRGLMAVRGSSSRRSSPRGSGKLSSASGMHICPSVQGAPQSPQIWRRGRCLAVLGPSNSQSGRNGIANITTKAASPIQGVRDIPPPRASGGESV